MWKNHLHIFHEYQRKIYSFTMTQILMKNEVDEFEILPLNELQSSHNN